MSALEFDSRSELSRQQGNTTVDGDFFDKAVEAHVDGMKQSFAYFPDQEYRAFCEWILRQDGIRDRWLQLTAVIQQIRLTEKLLDGILNEDELNHALPYCVGLNTYLTYEVVSDNLAIGLALRQPDDHTYTARHQLLQVFNAALSQQIRKTPGINATSELEALRPLMRNISAFDQSLNPLQHEQIASAFLAEHGDTAQAENLEYGLYSTLVANIESCLYFTEVMSEFDLYPFLQDKLARRYEGVNQLLDDTPLSIKELVDIGADTILIMPVVGYYSAIVGEALRPTRGYQSILADGSLMNALHDAALLIRLLNDLGTRILEQTAQERQNMMAHLRQRQQEFESFDKLLLDMTELYGNNLTRLRKDLQFGEFNIGLYEPLRAGNMEDAINIFEQNLDYLSKLYHERQQALSQTATHLSHRMGGTAVAQVIVRSVRFHQMVYSQSFDGRSGEYAI